MTRHLAVALICCFAACARKEVPRGAERVAILPFENLTGDASLDWIGPATAAIAVGQATGSPTLHPFFAPTRQDALRARATRIVSGYFVRSDGAIRASAVDEDLRSRKTRPVSSIAKMEPDPTTLATALVRQLGSATRPRGPKTTEAARHYGLALTAASEDVRREALEKSLAADPSYGEARVALVEAMMARGDRARVERLLADIPQGADDLSRARLDMARATLAGDTNARIDALRKVSDLTPADGDVARAFASFLTTRRRFDEAIRAYRRAIAADPEAGIVWNDLAYAQAFAGNLDGARASLAEYDRLDPASANPQDSLGEVLHYHGRFDEAEAAFLEAYRRNPSFLDGGELAKAAQSALWRGDHSRVANTRANEIRAGEHMKRFLEVRRKSDAASAERIEAQWDYLAGRRKEARERMERLASRLVDAPGGAAVDWAQLAVWSLVERDREKARGYAKRSAERRGPSGMPVVAALALFVTEPSASAAEWKARADRAFPGTGLATFRRQAQAYSLFADGQFADAVPLLRALVDSAPPSADGLFRGMLGVALRETGAKDEASRLLARHALPSPGGWDIFLPLVFSKLTP